MPVIALWLASWIFSISAWGGLDPWQASTMRMIWSGGPFGAYTGVGGVDELPHFRKR